MPAVVGGFSASCAQTKRNMPNLRNLALRSAKPALGNGHVQRLAKRALLMLDRDAGLGCMNRPNRTAHCILVGLHELGRSREAGEGNAPRRRCRPSPVINRRRTALVKLAIAGRVAPIS
jgi:hypothetical protein